MPADTDRANGVCYHKGGHTDLMPERTSRSLKVLEDKDNFQHVK